METADEDTATASRSALCKLLRTTNSGQHTTITPRHAHPLYCNAVGSEYVSWRLVELSSISISKDVAKSMLVVLRRLRLCGEIDKTRRFLPWALAPQVFALTCAAGCLVLRIR
ncbi:hypothetical protein BDN71DRAFT_1052152 [Pleurotus eryngii]|uniref:Uncharacterized protein n=1 Tax=Pleurotus eryngii TaxID=5323 RepID=A0A9P5ZWW9_PLEER|nr:hypothetical protein BDN71DRAFT_1052152 [Pleurotus eryngii]